MAGAFMLLPLLAAAGPVEPPPPVPPSLRQDQLEACAPVTLEAAEDCLRRALSPEDLAIVQDRILARQFRPGLDWAIQRAWRLRERTSPMARVMHALLGFYRADIAAGMIISDLQVRATDPAGNGIDFPVIAEALKQNPPPPEDPVSSETTAAPETSYAN